MSDGPYRDNGDWEATAGDPEERAWTQAFAGFVSGRGLNGNLNNSDMWQYIIRDAGRFADAALVEWRKRWRPSKGEDNG